jgi:hypothetical protein
MTGGFGRCCFAREAEVLASTRKQKLGRAD